MHAQELARLEVVGDDLAAQLAPGAALTMDLLEAEAVTTEETGAQVLLKADRQLHAPDTCHEGVAMRKVAVARLRRDVERKDLSRQARGERDHSRPTLRGVLAHEDGAATQGPLEHAADAATAAHLRRRLHDDRLRHPRQLSGLREDRLARIERDLEHWHGGADDPVLHESILRTVSVTRSLGMCSASLPASTTAILARALPPCDARDADRGVLARCRMFVVPTNDNRAYMQMRFRVARNPDPSADFRSSSGCPSMVGWCSRRAKAGRGRLACSVYRRARRGTKVAGWWMRRTLQSATAEGLQSTWSSTALKSPGRNSCSRPRAVDRRSGGRHRRRCERRIQERACLAGALRAP